MKLPSENALGPQEDEGEVEPEHGHVFEDRCDVVAAQGLHDADEERRHQRPGDAAEAAHGHADKGDQAEHGADLRVHGQVRGHDAPGNADGGPADAENQQIDPLRVDAHQLRGLLVHGGGLDGPTEARAADHVVREAHHDECHDGGDELGHGHDQGSQQKRLVSQPGVGEDAEVGRELVEAEVLEEHRQPEGRQQGGERGFADRVLDDQPIRQGPQDKDEKSACEHGDEGIHVQQEPQPVRDVHRDHHVLAVGEVDHVHHAPDQAEPDGHEGVEHAVEDAVQKNLKQSVHKNRGFHKGAGGPETPGTGSVHNNAVWLLALIPRLHGEDRLCVRLFRRENLLVLAVLELGDDAQG
jgi:hypothetical protein